MITTSSQDRILTNQLLLDELELWNLFDSKSIDDDQTQKYYQLIDDLLDSQIGESISWLQSDAAKEYFFEQISLQKEIFDALEDSWDDILENSYSSVDELLDNIYEVGKEKGYSNIRESLRYTDADKEAIRIAKDYNFHLIRKLDNDLRGTVKNKILKGIISGENPYNLAKTLVDAGVQQLDGSTFTPRQRATMIAKTETSRMQNTGMLQSYINEGYTQVKILTAEDNHVCNTCLYYAYHYDTDKGLTYESRGEERIHDIVTLIKGGKFPPFHPVCRCTYLTVWESKTDPPENPPIINLTPIKVNGSNNKNYDILNGFFGNVYPGKPTGQKFNMPDDEFEKRLSDIIDSKDRDMVKSIFYLFKDQLPTEVHEWGAVSFAKDNSYGFGDKKNNINIPYWIKKFGHNYEIPLMIHNHLVGRSPLPSEKDLFIYANCGVKYGITTNEIGTFIIKNNNIESNKNNSKKVKKAVVNIKSDIIDDFSRDVRVVTIDNLTNQDKIDLENYVIEHHDKYTEIYQNVLRDNGFTAIFI